MNRDEQFLQDLGIEPCDITRPIPHDWTERDIRETTVDPDEIRVACELLDKKNQLIENLSRTVELMEYQERHLRGLLLSWKVLGWCGWGVVGLCIWRGLAR